MAKVNAKQVSGIASKAGAPKKPKAPHAPKIKSPEELKKQAQAKAKARAKRLLKIFIMLAVVALIALIVYLVKYYGRQPHDALKPCIEYAYKNKVSKFRDCFTHDSIMRVDGGQEDNEEAWQALIDSITPVGAKTKIGKETIKTENNRSTAEVEVTVGGIKRTIFMRRDDGRWLINLNVAINPNHVELPPDIPESYRDSFTINKENDAWWDEAEPEEEAQKNNGFLSKFKFFKKR